MRPRPTLVGKRSRADAGEEMRGAVVGRLDRRDRSSDGQRRKRTPSWRAHKRVAPTFCHRSTEKADGSRQRRVKFFSPPQLARLVDARWKTSRRWAKPGFFMNISGAHRRTKGSLRPGGAADRIGRGARRSECGPGGPYGALRNSHQSECRPEGPYGALRNSPRRALRSAMNESTLGSAPAAEGRDGNLRCGRSPGPARWIRRRPA